LASLLLCVPRQRKDAKGKDTFVVATLLTFLTSRDVCTDSAVFFSVFFFKKMEKFSIFGGHRL